MESRAMLRGTPENMGIMTACTSALVEEGLPPVGPAHSSVPSLCAVACTKSAKQPRIPTCC
eukprot:7168005-Alexandrium_andersonii.AAC.1